MDKCQDGVFGTMAEAIGELDRPNIKSTRPYKSYDGPLTLGNPQTAETALAIQVERYFLTKLARPPPATTVVLKAGPDSGTAVSTQTLDVEMGVDLAKVNNARRYTVPDPEAPGGKRDVDFARLEKGYEYGRTVVHISESDRNVTQLETRKGLSIVGFISQENVSLFCFSETDNLLTSTV